MCICSDSSSSSSSRKRWQYGRLDGSGMYGSSGRGENSAVGGNVVQYMTFSMTVSLPSTHPFSLIFYSFIFTSDLFTPLQP